MTKPGPGLDNESEQHGECWWTALDQSPTPQAAVACDQHDRGSDHEEGTEDDEHVVVGEQNSRPRYSKEGTDGQEEVVEALIEQSERHGVGIFDRTDSKDPMYLGTISEQTFDDEESNMDQAGERHENKTDGGQLSTLQQRAAATLVTSLRACSSIGRAADF